MRNLISPFLILLTFTLTAQSKFGMEMASILENMKTYTIAVAEAMPEDKYDYRPAPEVRSFREQLNHIGRIMEFQTNFPLQGKEIDPQTWPEERKKIFGQKMASSKEEMKAFLENQFDQTIEAFKNLEEADLQKEFTFFFLPEKPKKKVPVIAMALRDHISHHRAQAIVYLRINGVEPPFYQLF